MRSWKVRLGAPAFADFRDALRFTRERFGSMQVSIYRTTILAALDELRDGPDVVGSRSRNDLARGLRTLHIARQGRRGRHMILYRVEPPDMIQIIRILHDTMDLPRHLPPTA